MTDKYWESETPVAAGTGKNVFRLFEKAGKLQVSAQDWTDKEGNRKSGKTVTVDLAALRESPEAAELFRRVLVQL